jgi:cell division protein FtsW (lipid II flippase)
VRNPRPNPSVTIAVPLPFVSYGGTPTTGRMPLTMPMLTNA